MRRTNKDDVAAPARVRLDRPYRLSSAGLASLQAAARANRPWSRSTGPRTAAGKSRSSRNAVRHGLRAASFMAAMREVREGLRAAEQLLR